MTTQKNKTKYLTEKKQDVCIKHITLYKNKPNKTTLISSLFKHLFILLIHFLSCMVISCTDDEFSLMQIKSNCLNLLSKKINFDMLNLQNEITIQISSIMDKNDEEVWKRNLDVWKSDMERQGVDKEVLDCILQETCLALHLGFSITLRTVAGQAIKNIAEKIALQIAVMLEKKIAKMVAVKVGKEVGKSIVKKVALSFIPVIGQIINIVDVGLMTYEVLNVSLEIQKVFKRINTAEKLEELMIQTKEQIIQNIHEDTEEAIKACFSFLSLCEEKYNKQLNCLVNIFQSFKQTCEHLVECNHLKNVMFDGFLPFSMERNYLDIQALNIFFGHNNPNTFFEDETRYSYETYIEKLKQHEVFAVDIIEEIKYISNLIFSLLEIEKQQMSNEKIYCLLENCGATICNFINKRQISFSNNEDIDKTTRVIAQELLKLKSSEKRRVLFIEENILCLEQFCDRIESDGAKDFDEYIFNYKRHEYIRIKIEALKYFLEIVETLFSDSKEDTEKFSVLISILDSECVSLIEEIEELFLIIFLKNEGKNSDKSSGQKKTSSDTRDNKYEKKNNKSNKDEPSRSFSMGGDPPRSPPRQLRAEKTSAEIKAEINAIIKWFLNILKNKLKKMSIPITFADIRDKKITQDTQTEYNLNDEKGLFYSRIFQYYKHFPSIDTVESLISIIFAFIRRVNTIKNNNLKEFSYVLEFTLIYLNDYILLENVESSNSTTSRAMQVLEYISDPIRAENLFDIQQAIVEEMYQEYQKLEQAYISVIDHLNHFSVSTIYALYHFLKHKNINGVAVDLNYFFSIWDDIITTTMHGYGIKV
ncbi:hypothetical protein CDIK_3702, partial [Cucumispora dikerogammari]